MSMPREAKTGRSDFTRAFGRWWPSSPRKSTFRRPPDGAGLATGPVGAAAVGAAAIDCPPFAPAPAATLPDWDCDAQPVTTAAMTAAAKQRAIVEISRLISAEFIRFQP